MSATLALLSAGLVVAWLATGGYLALARTHGWGKAVRKDGPSDHLKKEGTPTMGGVAFLVAALLVLALAGLAPGMLGAIPLPGRSEVAAGALVAVVADGPESTMGSGMPDGGTAVRGAIPALALLILASGALGLWDDLTSLTRKRRTLAGENVDADAATGLLARWRLLGQGAAAIAFAAWAVANGYAMFGVAALDLLGFAFVIVGTINAFNMTDGLDGLAAGTAAIVLLAFWGDPVAVVLTGALIGFLWFNAHPAKLFMGGVGSEALGAAVAGLAIVHGDVWRLPLLAIVPLAEVLSVIVQVSWFRATGGRRLLRMSPLHHHFELSGWPETRVVARFWIVSILALVITIWSRLP